MKKFRKLIPALCMLLISAMLMGTSTYAWFSMNKNVTATGMQVKAKTDAYLIITAGESLSSVKDTTATASLNASLYPCKPMETLNSTNIETLSSWGYGTSDNPNDANTGASLTALGSHGEIFGDYVAKQSFKVGILEGSGTPANDLKLKALTISNANAGITVVVVCGENVYSHNADVNNGNDKLAEKTAVTTSGVQVDVYIYIDGSNQNVYTNNLSTLTGNITLTFSIEA